MHGTRLLRSGPWLVAIALAIVGVTFARADLAQAPGPDVPRDALGAATTEYQEEDLTKLLADQKAHEVPEHFDPLIVAAYVPEDNALTPQRIALGRKLYFDKRLSDDGSVSCATCHDVTRGFTDQLSVSKGIGGQLGKRNAPTTLNVVLLQILFWDGRSPTLEHQARQPILNPVEMGMANEAAAMKAISDDPEYQKAFKEAFGRDMNYEDVGRAIAAFERTLVFVDSPWRRFLDGDEKAISAEARAGFDLYNGKGRCTACHPLNPSNPLGSDNRFHNVGVSARHQDFEGLARKAIKALGEDASERKLDELAVASNLSELGRFMITQNRSDVGAFRTPMVLNVGITAPYMHDGSMKTLWDVIDHYNKGGEANPFLDGGIEPLALTEQEIDQLVAFLFALTDVRFAERNRQALDEQRAIAKRERPFRDEELANRKTLPFERRVFKTKTTGK